jgi:hypothetical protein
MALPRDTPESDEPLTKEQLKAMTRRLAMLSPQSVADAYRRAHEQCGMSGNDLPKTSSLQELVTAWKLLRAWQGRKREDGYCEEE